MTFELGKARFVFPKSLKKKRSSQLSCWPLRLFHLRITVVPEDGISEKKFLRPIPVDSRLPVEGKREAGDGYERDPREPDGDASDDSRFTLFIGIGGFNPDFRVVVNEAVVTS